MNAHKLPDTAGDWQNLDTPAQNVRYTALADLIRAHGPASVLDVGCGEGLLMDYLPGALYSGVESSALASANARSLHPRASIAHSSAEAFESMGNRWDCIVFNECLYYMADPIAVLRRYAAFLNPGGIIVISIYQNMKRPTWKAQLRHLFSRRTPASNIQCSQMVDGFIAEEGWRALVTKEVSVPGRDTFWKMTVASP